MIVSAKRRARKLELALRRSASGQTAKKNAARKFRAAQFR
jgi:hypothetical protein